MTLGINTIETTLGVAHGAELDMFGRLNGFRERHPQETDSDYRKGLWFLMQAMRGSCGQIDAWLGKSRYSFTAGGHSFERGQIYALKPDLGVPMSSWAYTTGMPEDYRNWVRVDTTRFEAWSASPDREFALGSAKVANAASITPSEAHRRPTLDDFREMTMDDALGHYNVLAGRLDALRKQLAEEEATLDSFLEYLERHFETKGWLISRINTGR